VREWRKKIAVVLENSDTFSSPSTFGIFPLHTHRDALAIDMKRHAWSERQIIAQTSFFVYQNQSSFSDGLIGFDRQRRKFVLLSASYSTRVSTPSPQSAVQVSISIDGSGHLCDGAHSATLSNCETLTCRTRVRKSRANRMNFFIARLISRLSMFSWHGFENGWEHIPFDLLRWENF